ncbi:MULTISPECIES: phycobilisome linker polypeptide [Leptolyngbya]|jgi:phycocyanin-associated rod linker protein|uniref:Phycobilisome linker polypeptide n=2 Tax=Leptolyngbya boryana TaxID=1184 RepID=A0A1Z4JF13_LEPBY|nr:MULTISPECIES: phycobilisome linker polypeptide [Leptolyngbya]BAY55364.1 phycobilisome linker polypeptide [Leptolyngbya boryana NIES-2135]MBD1854464.1 phycobilisome linker polypeptide [Leptolyngbya sp. FACHB-1624]MBD2368482.1 phycobilisome linker polypeptide [Leptolyngbya sp. FACHB-161]MBD2374862.1 phycobilisome linker polypeptide [Leptolyngbya sp. FACHB-238]MBD2399282.1 phycobilisome linker polypeptide [Leptolyngbya sp. FACHB-239]
MPGLQEAARLGITPFEEAKPVELRANWTQDEVQAVIRAAYRQVLGNEHLMQSERLVAAESQLVQGVISVRDFVRAIATSDLYREKFLYPNFHVRFIELNYKHFLGRAPYEQAEISYHLDLFLNEGYEAEINSYLDSVEYQSSFGENIVPYHRDFQVDHPGSRAIGFSRLLHLYRGYANSDRSQGQKQPRLTWEVAKNLATPISAPSATALSGALGGNRGDVYRLRVLRSASPNSAVVRQATTEVLVSYDQLSSKLQQLNRSGSRVVSVTPV